MNFELKIMGNKDFRKEGIVKIKEDEGIVTARTKWSHVGK